MRHFIIYTIRAYLHFLLLYSINGQFFLFSGLLILRRSLWILMGCLGVEGLPIGFGLKGYDIKRVCFKARPTDLPHSAGIKPRSTPRPWLIVNILDGLLRQGLLKVEVVVCVEITNVAHYFTCPFQVIRQFAILHIRCQ
jgi:hypothetical protein